MEDKNYKMTCLDCKFLDACRGCDDKYHCNKHNIDINIIDETDDECTLDKDICIDFEEAIYRITEQGILFCVLNDLGIVEDIGDKRISTAWEIFFEEANQYGFYRYNDDDPNKEYIKTDKTIEDVFKSAIKVVFKVNDEDALNSVWVLFVSRMKKANYW